MSENNQNKLVMLQDLGMLYPTLKSKRKARYGLYICKCGKKIKAIVNHVKNNNTTSCGCFRKEEVSIRFKKHGMGKHRLYNVWRDMIRRCYDDSNKAYKNYGGRGIYVCERWHSLVNFIIDMDSSFQEGLTIDREKNDLGYSKDNCRWVTKNIQSRNTRQIMSTNKSGFRGVYFDKGSKKFRVVVTVDSKRIHIGRFINKIDAAMAYDKYIKDNMLEHTLNFKILKKEIIC